MRYLNVAFYKFIPLENLESWRSLFHSHLTDLGIRGTILLASEGINGFLSGPEHEVKSALMFIQNSPSFGELTIKESYSTFNPFERLLIKIKSEIVTFRVEGISPIVREAPRVSPEQLCQWYDEKEDFLIIDTRNEYEFRLGSFDQAISLGLKHFVEFADAAKKIPEEYKKKKVVTFCTGGIRCEKAAPYLETLGFEHVFQLDGGILNYFETNGGSHWHGDCFVFDNRIALTPKLEPSGAVLCPHCQGPKNAGPCIHCGQ